MQAAELFWCTSHRRLNNHQHASDADYLKVKRIGPTDLCMLIISNIADYLFEIAYRSQLITETISFPQIIHL
jgi:hypothetical protein